MVQLFDHSHFGSWKDSGQLYWKLDKGIQFNIATLLGMLEDRRFSHKDVSTRERLQELYIRYQRGLMSYQAIVLPELKLFVAQRSLSVGVDQKDDPESLRTILEHADDKATFDRFTDLLPELHLQIYTHYFNSFAETRAYIVSQPPITGVSQGIRKESLPVFYRCCTFNIDVGNSFLSLERMSHSDHTHRLLQRTTTEQMGWIRNVNLNIDIASTCVDLRIDLDDKLAPVKKCHITFMRSVPLTPKAVAQLSLELGEMVQIIATREGDAKLQKGDVKELRDKVRSISFNRGNHV
jgi:hypothetical protein